MVAGSGFLSIGFEMGTEDEIESRLAVRSTLLLIAANMPRRDSEIGEIWEWVMWIRV